MYADSTYPNIVVEIENNSLWDIQYPGLLFSTNDPYIQFSGMVGFYYVLPNDWTYPMWESITVSPYTPENHIVNATITFITIDSMVICDIPISFVLNPTINSVEESRAEEIQLFPNPATDWLEVSDIRESSLHVKIISSDGRMLSSEILSQGQAKINIQSLPTGIYFLEMSGIENQSPIRRSKFIKE